MPNRPFYTPKGLPRAFRIWREREGFQLVIGPWAARFSWARSGWFGNGSRWFSGWYRWQEDTEW